MKGMKGYSKKGGMKGYGKKGGKDQMGGIKGPTGNCPPSKKGGKGSRNPI